MLDDMIEQMKKKVLIKQDERRSRFEEKITKKGRTIKQQAENFVHELKPLLIKFPLGINLRGLDVRTMVTNPNSAAFRQHCKKNGLKVVKVQRMDIYRFETYDNVKEELKKRENTSML